MFLKRNFLVWIGLFRDINGTVIFISITEGISLFLKQYNPLKFKTFISVGLVY